MRGKPSFGAEPFQVANGGNRSRFNALNQLIRHPLVGGNLLFSSVLNELFLALIAVFDRLLFCSLPLLERILSLPPLILCLLLPYCFLLVKFSFGFFC